MIPNCPPSHHPTTGRVHTEHVWIGKRNNEKRNTLANQPTTVSINVRMYYAYVYMYGT